MNRHCHNRRTLCFPGIEFAEGASATGIDLYSEGGDLLNIDGEFINDSGSTLAFVWFNGKWVVEI